VSVIPRVGLRLPQSPESLNCSTTCFPPARINVAAFKAKDGALRGSARDIEFPDGRRMDMGGSSKDGQDKPDK
jgi:hypothetical protein